MTKFALNVPVLDEEDNTGIFVTEADPSEVPESWRDLGPFAWVFWHHIGHMRVILVEELRIDHEALAKVAAFAAENLEPEPDPEAWVVEGARARFVNESWPRVRLEKDMVGTVTDIDRYPNGTLRWVTVVYDNHEGWSHGVHHYGWHVTQKHIVPADSEASHA